LKEFILYVKKLDFNSLFLAPTENTIIQLFRYAFVGGVAFVVDWLTMVILTEHGLYYLIATVVGFILGLVANFILSKLLVFKKSNANLSLVREFIDYAIIGVIGLGLTELLMYLLTDVCNVYYALSKVISAVIVLFWNFLARKVFIYKAS
jgi:putative flippase GtrA